MSQNSFPRLCGWSSRCLRRWLRRRRLLHFRRLCVFILAGCREDLNLFLHGMKKIRGWIRRVQYRGEYVDGAENVLVDREQNLGNLGLGVYFQSFLNVQRAAFQGDSASHSVLHDIGLRRYSKLKRQHGLITALLLFLKFRVDIEK